MKTKPISAHFSRREVIRTLATIGTAAAIGAPLLARAKADELKRSREDILQYFQQHARRDGGYGFDGQERSHLTACHAVIGSWRLLQATPADTRALTEFVRSHHPRVLKPLGQDRRSFELQQVQALLWLGDSAGDLRAHLQSLAVPAHYPKVFERSSYPMMQAEVGIARAYQLLGLSTEMWRPAFTEYILTRRRQNGSFNNTPTSDGGDGHVMNTLWGLEALQLLGLPIANQLETVSWLRACQLPSGGFTFAPKPELGGVDDVAYTRAALRALKLVGGEPKDPSACKAWLRSLATADGGFSDRPGWKSNPPATYCVLDALDALGALDELEQVRRPASSSPIVLPTGLKVFSLQVEAHGSGSPADVVNLAAALRTHLWGCKAPNERWIAQARALAKARGVAMEFFPADEEYDTWLNIPGIGTYSRATDTIAPPTGGAGKSLSGPTALSWSDFRERRIGPLERGGGRLIWQFAENEELTRMLLDDSVEHGGYAAISTYHYNNPDFANSEPFLYRWRGRIPYIALQDAHGAEPWWWSDMTTGFRTLFLAEEPTWEGWLQALKEGWVAAMRHDEVSRNQTWMHSGSEEVLDFVRAHEEHWRWWDNPEIRRPLVSLVALKPDENFEVGRPEKGLALRVRCAWTNSTGGVLVTPLAELVHLEMDGEKLTPTRVEKNRANGTGLGEVYFYHEFPAIKAGAHRAVAIVREISTGREVSSEINFNVS